MFLNDDDYLSVIDSHTLNVITEDDEQIRESAEKRAIELISSYLRNRYDVDVIFAKTGDERNIAVVSWVVDIALYNLHSRLPGRMAGELRKERYDCVMQELEGIAKGKTMPDLPLINADDSGNPVKWGSQQQYNNRW